MTQSMSGRPPTSRRGLLSASPDRRFPIPAAMIRHFKKHSPGRPGRGASSDDSCDPPAGPRIYKNKLEL